jgi:ABC-type oligopeptide transport system ATPase subunit
MLLQLTNIKKYYPTKAGFFGAPGGYVKAVDGVDFTFRQGENVSIVGESGCGKTTLARVIVRLLKADAGSVIFEGRDILRLSPRELKGVRKNMQMVFQDPYSSLNPRFTIRRVMREAATLDRARYSDDAKIDAEARRLLGAVKLTGDILNRYPHEFSGGERQRVAIARALMLNPKLLILDEAVSSLDVIIQREIIDLLADLKKEFNLTYIFISHNLKVVRKISRAIVVMYKGKIVEAASTEEIFSRPLHPYTKELLAAAIDYKTSGREGEIKLDPRARLVDRGGGHFVVDC